MKKREEQKEKAQTAIKLLIAKIDENPDDVQAYYELGVALTEMKSYSQAEELFKRTLSAFSKTPEKTDILHYGLGNVYYASELYSEAITEFKNVKSKKLRNDAYLMIAQTNYVQENYEIALAFALTVAQQEQDSKNGDALKLVGDCFMNMGNFEQAKQYYDQALKIKPKDVAVLFQRGIIAMIDKDIPNKYFKLVKQIDGKYYKKMQSRLTDAETFVIKKQTKKE